MAKIHAAADRSAFGDQPREGSEKSEDRVELTSTK
jgi:hypothetical protein